MTAKNKGDGLVLTYEITKPDLYYLLLNDDGGNNYSLQPYVLTIEGGAFTTFYPIATIESLSPNPAIQGDTVTLSGSGTDGDGTVVAYQWTSDRDGILGNASVLTLNNLSMGRHRISLRVQDNEGHWSGTVYDTLYITDEILSESEYNNDTAHANPLPQATRLDGSIYPKGDEDYYKIYSDQRGYLSVLVDPVAPAMRAYISFYDAGGNWMNRYNYATNDGDWVSYEFFAEPGWYYIRIHDRDNRSHQQTYGVLFSFTPAQDLNEPNDSPSEATLIEPDTTVSDARICREGDEDWYRVEIGEGGRLSLSLTNAPQDMRGYLVLYNPNIDWLNVYNYAYNGGDDVFLDYDVINPGIYYIRVTDRDGRAHTEPYTFTCQFTPVVDNYENNYDAGHATLLPQSSVEAAIFPAGDRDWFKVYASSDSTLFLSVTQPPSDMRASIAIHNRDISWIGVYETANNNGDNVYLSYDIPEDGFYYIRVTDYNGRAHLTPYQFTVTGGSPGYEPPLTPATSENEPNSDYGEATYIALEIDVSGTIDPADDYDWYRFYVSSTGIVEVSHTNIPGEVTSEMWVYNANKNQIDYRTTTNPGEDNVLTTTITEAGYYLVRLADRGRDNSSSEMYTLRISHTPVVDGNEPNDNYGSATYLGQDTVQGYIFDAADEDWYRLYVRQPGNLSVSLDEVPAEIQSHLWLYNTNKGQVGSWLATNPGDGGSDLITYEVEDPGFYFVRIYDEGKNSYSNSTYTLRITGADFSLAPILQTIGDRTIDETIDYAFIIFATDPDNEQDLTYSASNLPPGASFDPNTRTFSWTPSRGQAGNYAGIHFEVFDGIYTDSEDITIIVNRLSRAPVLAPIGDKTIAANSQLTFQISGSDPDIGDTLTYSANNLPSGADFTPSTGTFSWTPTSEQVGLYPDIYFEVTDGYWTDFEYINIEVIVPEPDISVSPTSHDFGNVTIGSTSAAKTFTVTNTGDADLVIDTITITDINASEFSIQNDNCSEQTIIPSDNCTVDVVFSPTSAGAKSANLSIPSDDPDTPTLDIPLSGTGIEAKGSISGQVTLQSRVNHSGVEVSIDGGLWTGSTNAAGEFSIPDVNEGTHTVTVSMVGYLPATKTGVEVTRGSDTSLSEVMLLGGDTDADADVDLDDLATVAASFGATGGAADINANGVVDIFDLVLAGINIGETESLWP